MHLADDPELCELMVQAGFKKVFLGIETPSPAGLEECDKRQNQARDLGEAVRTVMSRVNISQDVGHAAVQIEHILKTLRELESLPGLTAPIVPASTGNQTT